MNRLVIVRALSAIRVFNPLEEFLVRHYGFSLRSWCSTKPAGVPYVPVLLLTTTGRASDKAQATPLFYVAEDVAAGGGYLVVASRGGAPRHPQWYLNLLAHPEVTIHVAGRRLAARAETVDEAERQRVWPLLVAVWPAYARYETTAAPRRIPVVRLTLAP